MNVLNKSYQIHYFQGVDTYTPQIFCVNGKSDYLCNRK